ncbi:ribonuclease R [Saccharicrinis sp. FJH62]|uniref:ribonuclease R n=1 Tax=Saccharicrinis sp. FJH62 TaxID=3344657 RepID=UPI0035D4AFDA
MPKQKGKKPKINKRNLSGLIMNEFIQTPKQVMTYKQLSKKLDLKRMSEKQLVNVVLTELADAGHLNEISTGRFRLNNQGAFITGTLSRDGSGAAYLVPDEGGEDVFIPDHALNKALNGDTVKVVVYARRKRRLPEGEVVEIIKRGKNDFVGVVEVSHNFAFLVPDTKRQGYDIFIPLDKLGEAKQGQKAIARIVDWPQKAKNPIGKIIEVLGNVGDNNAEMHAILAEYGLPHKYPENVIQAAEKISDQIDPEEIKKRRDFRKTTTFTIDPWDAKDFDDALSIKKLEDGLWEVGVHIADVTHYVRPKTLLENEAYKRATSVYLVDRVVPMLPERLSNNICSLRPNEEKLTFSAVFKMDENAEVKDSWIGRTVINSDRRFTYEEAQDILEGKPGDFEQELKILNSLAKKLRSKRFANGAINFERSEVKFEIDEHGKPLRVFFKEPKDSNQLIEEFMLLANRTVAEFIGKVPKGKKAKTFVYRIHDKPLPDKFDTFRQFIKKFGYKINAASEESISASLNEVLTKVKGKSEQNLIETIAIRSMAKAEYSTFNIGHYGLAFKYYSHFTSPIRRYPDMMVHRLLDRYMNGGRSVNEEQYEDMCQHSSDMEQLAAQAERSSIKYKQVEFMKDKLGEEFDGVISGVTEWGIYVELEENKCEGMVPLRDLDDDFYVFDDANYCITGRRTNKTYRLGDAVRIKVASANLEKKQLDFQLLAKQ